MNISTLLSRQLCRGPGSGAVGRPASQPATRQPSRATCFLSRIKEQKIYQEQQVFLPYSLSPLDEKRAGKN